MKRSLIHIYKLILFLLLEAAAVMLYVYSDNTSYNGSYNIINLSYTMRDNIENYVSLKDKNIDLQDQIKALQIDLASRNSIISRIYETHIIDSLQDSILNTLNIPNSITATIINQTILKKDNRFIINKGYEDGVRKNMCAMWHGAIVGYVIESDKNFAVVRTPLSNKFKSAGKTKGDKAFCSIWWDGLNPYEINFSEMTKYSEAKIGDTILTASFSRFFPENAIIGTISSIETIQDMYYNGKIKLHNNLKKINYVILTQNPLDSIQSKGEILLNNDNI